MTLVNTPMENIPAYDRFIAQESAHNLAILHTPLKHDFVNAVNALTGKSYMLLPPLEIHGEYPYGTGEGFPEDHEFYKTVYDYLLQNNPSLLNNSILAKNDGVTNSSVAFYMIDQVGRNQIRKTTRRSTMTATPEGNNAVKETAQNLSGLKALLVKDIADSSQKTDIVREVEDVEKKREYIIDSPASFNNSRTKEIQDVLALLPGNDHIFAEKMLNYLLIGGLIQSGVIPYVNTDGTTKLDFTPQCSPTLKLAWQAAANNANAFIPPETLKGFMAYTSTGQSPNGTMGVIDSRMPKNAPQTAANILRATSIPNSQKSLALTTLKNNNSTALLDKDILKDASADAARFSQAKIRDSLQMITDQTSRFEDLAKKGQLPKNEKEWADLVRSPVSEAGKRFGAGGSILVLFGSVMLAWKAGKALANKMSDGKAGWFGKTLGFITALAGYSVGSKILGNYIENLPLEKVDPNKTANEKKDLRKKFGKCVGAFDDIFPGFFILSQDVGRDTNNRPFGERITAASLFENGSPKTAFSDHPNIVDQKTELMIDGKKVSPESLKSYKHIYRTVYFRRQDIQEARMRETDLAKKEAIFDASILELGTKSLQKFLAEFYSKSPNNVEKILVEGFDMSPERINNFGLTAVPFIDQSARKGEIETLFSAIPPANPLLTVPAPDIPTVYDKKPQNIMVGGNPPQDTLQLPVWDPAELGSVTPSYEQTKLLTGEYLVKITYTPASPAGGPVMPAKECLCVMEPTTLGGKIYKTSSLLINDIAYTR